MPRRAAVNMGVTNVAANLAALRADSVTFQAHAGNSAVDYLSLVETGTAVVVATLAPRQVITIYGLSNLDVFDIVTTRVGAGDILFINPFLT